MSGSGVKTVITAICGASGSIYGIRLLKALLERNVHVYLMISNAGKQVLTHEVKYKGDGFRDFLAGYGVRFSPYAELSEIDEHDFFTPPASGSFRHNGMVIAPCSMGTLGAIAAGLAGNLIQRAADVCLKEKHPLILVPRETPVNLIHLQNMMSAATAGATILPASPSFYSHPESMEDLVDTVVARILDHLGIDHDLTGQWAIT